MSEYPKLEARGTVIAGDPPGVSPEEIQRILSPAEFQAFRRWGYGSTCGPYGTYPRVLEDFLERLVRIL